MPQQLPTHPNLDHLKKQAKDVLRVFRRQKPLWKLADAQRAIARGYGFANWPTLKTHVEKVRHELPTLSTSVPAFAPDDSAATKPSLRRAVPHPIVGAWVADPTASTHNDSQNPIEGVVLDFQVSGEVIQLNQVATDTTGSEIAITTTICPDGLEHPVPFGEGVRLKAVWTTSRMLEAAFTTSERTIGSWSYEVSSDGSSLIVSTATDRIVFKRL
jgi:hypothetical protein